ncbi:hypothetical protein KEM54_000736 [Ascosphaera aggregata]|nr:hypothetical protein KEM54_000736 [Ascosphaera aggregata]
MLTFTVVSTTPIFEAVSHLSVSQQSASRLLQLALLPHNESHEYQGSSLVFRLAPIKFHHVTFAYETNKENVILKQISFEIASNSCTAIVGHSGSGKSTIAALLVKLYGMSKDVINGTITLNGRDIRDLQAAALRCLISIVPQTPTIFPMSIAENIAYGLEKFAWNNTLTHIQAAAQAAGIDEFISSLPDGFETILGENGVGLSGGQAQRLAIARALLRQPKVLILDEATANLDNESAAQVKETIRNLLEGTRTSKKLTVIVITHARDMVELSNRAIVLNQGQVVEAGRTKDLLKRPNGKLRELFMLYDESENQRFLGWYPSRISWIKASSTAFKPPATTRMSSQELEDLRRRLEEAQRLKEQAENRLRELRVLTQQTTLPEFLDACHVHLLLGLAIQRDESLSTRGNPANADRKICPSRIREWTSFPTEQASVWEALMNTNFTTERHFTPLVAVKKSGREIRERMVGSELDLGYFQRQAIESRVASVVKQLHANARLRQTSSPRKPRRSSRLAAKFSRHGLSAQPPQRGRTATRQRTSRPRADQFCVYNKGPKEKVPAFIIEYKTPYKVSLAHIKAGLEDMDFNEVLRAQEEESLKVICRRTVAAVSTQTFSYIFHGGLGYGYVCTGEAYIFLHVPVDDPSTIYYYLSVPKEDVGSTTGWTGDPSGDNGLHLTALGQVLAFTLRALRVQVRHTAWTKWAASKLRIWEMLYDDLLQEIAEEDISASDYKPYTQSRLEYCRASPVKTRSRSAVVAACNSPEDPRSSSDDDAGDGVDPNTPSRQRPRESHLPHPSASSSLPTMQNSQGSRSKGQSRQYCTQKCLLGLVRGGTLDWNCPNVSDHGVDRHRLNRTTLIKSLNKQLSSEIVHPDKKLGCESLHIHGSCGALFKITLWSHGYTFVGKGVPVEFVDRLKNEELIYSRLASIQGTSVPVLVGSLQLRRPFYYDGIAEIVRLMCMGFAGRNLTRLHKPDHIAIIERAVASLRAIHNLSGLYGDTIPANMTSNEQDRCVMFIDFERSTLHKPHRIPLNVIPSNKTRKGEIGYLEQDHNERHSRFKREERRMICDAAHKATPGIHPAYPDSTRSSPVTDS